MFLDGGDKNKRLFPETDCPGGVARGGIALSIDYYYDFDPDAVYRAQAVDGGKPHLDGVYARKFILAPADHCPVIGYLGYVLFDQAA
ncbi:hypothetical protein [Sodalis sp. RH17]|uniref:hypothetical protein n=1 Tax=Sodalis sp. RH17 TaxID=3394332 RepID=UPI0039B3EE61